MAHLEMDNFAVVEFPPDKTQPHKRLIEVIRFAWLTEDANMCFCPKSKNWSFELKNNGLPRDNWIKYPCRVVKYNINTIKAANTECSLRLNYTSSDFSDQGENRKDQQQQKQTANMDTGDVLSYNDLFDQINDDTVLYPLKTTMPIKRPAMMNPPNMNRK